MTICTRTSYEKIVVHSTICKPWELYCGFVVVLFFQLLLVSSIHCSLVRHCGLVKFYVIIEHAPRWLKYWWCCLTALSHLMNQHWIIKTVSWHSYQDSPKKFARYISLISVRKRYIHTTTAFALQLYKMFDNVQTNEQRDVNTTVKTSNISSNKSMFLR